jgi:hypothetical protein
MVNQTVGLTEVSLEYQDQVQKGRVILRFSSIRKV